MKKRASQVSEKSAFLFAHLVDRGSRDDKHSAMKRSEK